jgi:hypothetical protein
MDTAIKAVKEQAKALQQALNEAGHDIGYSQCLELISKQNGFSDWNTYCAHLKSNFTTAPQPNDVPKHSISDLKRLSLIATAPTCRLIVLIDDIDPCDLIRRIAKDEPRPGGAFFNVVYDKKVSPFVPDNQIFFGTDFTLHPISEKFPWKSALRAMEKASQDAVFLFHPPTALYKEIDILACCRPAYVFMSEQEFLEIETHMRLFHKNLLLFKCSDLIKQEASSV